MPEFSISCPDFEEGGEIPKKFGYKFENKAPFIQFDNIPQVAFDYTNSTEYIKTILNNEKDKIEWSPKQINEYLGKASNGGGTWSSIAGKKQMTRSQPTREDWDKLNK